RLTNSPQFRAAGAWAEGQLKEWGLSNVHLEKWATPADNKIPSWQITSYSGAMVEPTYMPIVGVPVAWTAGTAGAVAGEAMLALIQNQADMDKFHGKLKGKIVLNSVNAAGTLGPLELPFPTTPLARRYTDSELTDLVPELFPGAGGRGGRGGARGGRAGANANLTPEELQALQAKLRSFMKDEGVLLTLQANARGESGTLFGGGAQNRMDTTNLPQVSITAEHYNRIARLLEHSVPVKLQFDIRTQFDTENTDSFNVIAEIPGSTKPNELVMVGGHFDSWHYGTGATDNAAGSAIAMEVMRILKSLNLKMDRTVRMGLWGGEEQGLLGSRAYVKEHFADPTVMKPTTEHDNFSSYFNIDNGTGRIRGIYLQGNEMARPVFESWFAALKDLTPGVITIRNTGGTDHQSYDGVGLPGFQFIQDPMDYDTRTHHSNMDVYDRIQQPDMEQMAIIEAVFVYNAATRPEKLPRKDLPPPQPAGRGGRGGGAAARGGN
ncbi:MAG: M20/M25/M40 family metallo-hydrolase, partial [Acidobacteriia bacterium]|nr:M20/M25/M40 family metallo-hydrolase [Terriglobia bacterium]